MTVGEKIRIIRKKNGLTQKQLGDKLGVSYQMIAQYENGKRNPKIDTIISIACALNVEMFDLMSIQEYNAKIDQETNERIEEQIQRGQIHVVDHKENTLIENYSKLNAKGQDKAIEQVELLTKIPQYQAQFTTSEDSYYKIDEDGNFILVEKPTDKKV